MVLPASRNLDALRTPSSNSKDRKYLLTLAYAFFFFFFFFRAAPVAYGGSQASSQIGTVATSLHHSYSHSHARSELRL